PASRRSPGPWDDGADAEPQELDELSAAEPVASQPPEPAVSSSRPPAAHLELSAEITQLLADAERRVAVELRSTPGQEARGESERPAEDDLRSAHAGDVEPLPEDVLEALEESLDDDSGAISFESMFPPVGTQANAMTTGDGT